MRNAFAATILIGILASLLGSCAIPPYSTHVSSKANSARAEIVCRKEKKTGSNRPVRVCRPKESSPIEQEQTQQDMRTLQSQTY